MNFYRPHFSNQADFHQHFGECPRCGQLAFENLSNYSHCVDCFYFEDYSSSPLAIDLELKELDRCFRLGLRPNQNKRKE
jgi:hypothetical protein